MNLESGAYINKLIIKNISNERIGLCTGWNLIDNYSSLPVDIIGTLYSKSGADLMIRNIFRCPEIIGLIILDDNRLGHNNIGKHGLTHVYNFFFKKEYQCDPYDRVHTQDLTIYFVNDDLIFKKINGQITQSTRGNIDLHDLISEIRLVSHKNIELIHRSPIIYPNPCILTKVKKDHHHETFGTNITGNNLFDAWKEVLNYLYHYGCDNDVVRQFHSIHWSFDAQNIDYSLEQAREYIRQEDVQNMIGISSLALTDYTKSIMDHTEIPNTSYTYGQRLKNYEQNIIKTLQEQISSRHAYATTIKYDTFDTQPPCLVYLQLLYDSMNHKLNMYVVFRSHDIFKAALPNGYAIAQLLKRYATILNVNIGQIEITSISAHIYLSDLYNADLFLQCLNNRYKPEIHFDPRGYCVITPIDGQISFEIRDNISHEIIFHMIDKGKNIFQTLLDRKIITNLEHLAYIHKELNEV